MVEVIPRLEALPYLERYAWFHLGFGNPDPVIATANLCDAVGGLTRAGLIYRDLATTGLPPLVTVPARSTPSNLIVPAP
jgi:Glycosyl hydrolase catalytic core